MADIKSFSEDIDIVNRITSTFSTDAILKGIIPTTFTTDAILKKTTLLTFTADALNVSEPFAYQKFSGTSFDATQILFFKKQAKYVVITVEDNPLTVQGAYGNQSSYSYNAMFEGEISLPVGTNNWVFPTSLRMMKIKSTNAGSPAKYQIVAWFYPSKR